MIFIKDLKIVKVIFAVNVYFTENKGKYNASLTFSNWPNTKNMDKFLIENKRFF